MLNSSVLNCTRFARRDSMSCMNAVAVAASREPTNQEMQSLESASSAVRVRTSQTSSPWRWSRFNYSFWNRCDSSPSVERRCAS